MKNIKNLSRLSFLKRLSKEKGFTLIELLVVIFIIGVLVSLLLANILGARQRAEDVEKKSDLNQVKKALRLFYNDNQSYPASVTQDGVERFTNSTTAGGTAVLPGSAFTSADGNTIYMKEVPEYGQYQVDTNNERFVLIIELDNASDQDIASSWQRCGDSLVAITGSNALATGSNYIVCAD